MKTSEINQKEVLIQNLGLIHTTELGKERIKRNLSLNAEDAVEYCVSKIEDDKCVIYRKGKNWYAELDHYIITINAYNYCIITAHKN